MREWVSIIVIIFFSFSFGHLILQWLYRNGYRFDADPLERFFASITLGATTLGWIALVLAELGLFSIQALGAIWLALATIICVLLWRRRASGHFTRFVAIQEKTQEQPHEPAHVIPFLPRWSEFLFLGIWLLAASWLFFRPHEFIIGGADAGVYVSLGAEIASDGSIVIQDKFLASLDPALYPSLLREINNPEAPFYLQPAFFVTGDPRGEITPQFYPLFPVWNAVANGLGGVRAELLMAGLWGLLGAMAIYLTVRRLTSWEIAALALAGLTINALQVWFSRYPTTETLSQYLLWTGIWSIGAWLSAHRPQPIWGLLAGLALGSFFLVRIDTLFILPIFLLLAAWLWMQGPWQKSYYWFFAPLTALVGHSLLHAMAQSRPYFFELFGVAINMFKVNWLVPAGAAILGIVALWSMARFQGEFDRLTLAASKVRIIGIGAILLLAGYAWFLRPAFGEAASWNDPFSTNAIPLLNHENLVRLGWYLSPIGIWLGVAGVCFMVWHTNRRNAFLLAVGSFFSLFYLWRISANPHQIYAMRRYVPAVMPMFITAAAYAISWMVSRRSGWTTALALLASASWLIGLMWSARGFISQTDYSGIIAQLESANELLDPNSILIFSDESPVGVGDFLGTPLRFLYKHDVLKLHNPNNLDNTLFVKTIDSWNDEGRTVYWIGDPVWLDQQGYQYETNTVSIATNMLEGVYDHKPSRIIPINWELVMAEIAPR